MISFIRTYSDFKISFSERSAEKNFFNMDQIGKLRGICAIGIVLHHILLATNFRLLYPFKYFGNLGVAFFFLISGYGCMIQYLRKSSYERHYIKKRFTSIAVPTLVCSLIYICVYWVYDISINPVDVILGWANGLPFIPYSWYLVACSYFYIAFYFYIKSKSKQLYLWGFFMIIGYICCMLVFGYHINEIRTGVCFVAGMIIANKHDTVTNWIKGKYILMLSGLIVAFGGLFSLSWILKELNMLFSMVIYASAALCFSCLLVLIACKIEINSKLLDELGKDSFEIYLLHGLFIFVLKDRFMDSMFSILVIVSTIFLAAAVHRINNKLLKCFNV